MLNFNFVLWVFLCLPCLVPGDSVYIIKSNLLLAVQNGEFPEWSGEKVCLFFPFYLPNDKSFDDCGADFDAHSHALHLESRGDCLLEETFETLAFDEI